MSEIDFKTFLGNILFCIQECFEKIMKTLVHCFATFLIWFIIVLAIGLGMLSTLKMFTMIF